MSETCGLPTQPGTAEASDAFASIQVMGKQTTEKELDDKVVVQHIYKLNEDGTVTIIFKYEDGTEEVFDVLPSSAGLLQEQSQEGFPWKIWKIKKIKEALERRRQHPPSPSPLLPCNTSGDFNFSFLVNTSDPAEGLITGCISGLSCNNETAVATSVRVLTNDAGVGLGEYISAGQNNFENSFNVTASCEIVRYTMFASIGSSFSLAFDSIATPATLLCAGLTSGPVANAFCNDQVKFQYIP